MTTITKNFVPLSDIYIPPEEDGRIRDPENTARAVSERTRSILRFGQLQPILIEKLDEPINGKEWKLLDGQVRWISLSALTARATTGDEEAKEAFDAHGMRPGEVEVTTRDSMDPTVALMIEFHANEDRDDFTWDEKGKYIRRIHDMLEEEHGKDWTAKKTADYINQSPATVSHYLQLTDESDPATQSESVRKATTKGAAIKKLKIEKEKRLRMSRIEKVEERARKEGTEYLRAARLAIQKGDCRDWIKKIPDSSLSWFHWDPPYGGKEGKGGAFAGHEGIQEDHDYALDLMQNMFEEIWRVLHDGAWLAIWYTPVHYHMIRYLLQGHRFDSQSGSCLFCDRHILRDHAWLSANYSCRPSPYSFWVNPYPNYWRKTNRVADGHEIQRFFTKETEPFLIAGKQDEKTPILLRSDRGNVFDFEGFRAHSEERRHVHHKPESLLRELLSCISVPGALGADAGSGSGSIIEAAYGSGRKVITAELNESYWETSLTVGADVMKELGITPRRVAPWLEKVFDGES